MTRRFPLIAMLALCPLLSGRVALGETSKHDDALTLVSVSGRDEAIEAIRDRLLKSLETKGVPKGSIDTLRKYITPDEYRSKAADVFAKHFTQEELRSLIEFYRTTVGQKWAHIAPQFTADMQQIGEQLGAEAMRKAAEEDPFWRNALEEHARKEVKAAPASLAESLQAFLDLSALGWTPFFDGFRARIS